MITIVCPIFLRKKENEIDCSWDVLHQGLPGLATLGMGSLTFWRSDKLTMVGAPGVGAFLTCNAIVGGAPGPLPAVEAFVLTIWIVCCCGE